MSSPTRPPADIQDQDSLGGEGFVQAASRLIGQQAYPDAVRLCRQGLTAHPQNNKGRLVLGLALLGLENHLDLLTESEQAASFAPFEPLAHRLLGEALLALGRHGEARAALDQARELSHPGQDQEPLWVLLEQVCEGPRGDEAEGTPAARDASVMAEPDSWGDPDDFTNIMDDPPALSPLEGTGENQDPDEDEDERYTTAPWLPPSYLERMRQGAAEENDDSEMYVADEQTVSEVLTPTPEVTDGDSAGAALLDVQSQPHEMVDDNDTVSLAEDYQELLQRAEGTPGGEVQAGVVDDEETVSLPEGYRELLEAATADRERAEKERLLPADDTPTPDSTEESGEHPISEEEAIAALTGVDIPVAADLPAQEDRGTEEDLSRSDLEPDGLEDPTLAGHPLEPSGEAARRERQQDLYVDDDETGVGVDQELLLASMERAVQALPRVQLHPEDDSSAALVDSGLISEWGAAEASSVVMVPEGGELQGPTETTAAEEAPSFSPEGPVTDEQSGILEQHLDLPDEEGWPGEELEEDEATVAKGAELLAPLDAPEEERAWGDVDEDPGEPTRAQISTMATDSAEALAELDADDEQTVARGHDPLGPLDEDDEMTVARGQEPLGPLDEAEWDEVEEDPGEPTVAQLSPMAGEDEQGWPADELEDEGEQTVVRDGLMMDAPSPEPAAASAGSWGDQQAPRVPDQSTKPIDLQPGEEAQVALESEVSLIIDGDLDEDGLEPLDSEELSEISVEMVLEEDLPPLPPMSGVVASEDGLDEDWGAAAAMPPFEEEQGFGDPYGYGEEEEEEEEYAEATQVRVDLPQLRAIVSDELDVGEGLGGHALDDGADAEFPDDDSVQEEETGFYQESNAEVAFPDARDESAPYPPQSYGGDETPAGVEGFPDASYPYSQAPAGEPPAHFDEDPFASMPGDAPAYLEEERFDPEPMAAPSAPAASPAITAEAPPYQPRVERTENLRTSSPGPASPQGTPVEVYDARTEWPEAAGEQPASAPAPAPDPRRATMPIAGSARLDRAARTGTNIVAMLKGRPGSKRLPLLIVSTVGVIVLAFGIGRVVRHMRLGDQIEEKRDRAAKQLRVGNMLDYTAASQSYAEILKYRPEDMAAKWAQARVQAAIPVEFGDPNPQASRGADQTGKPSEDRLAADIYAALFTGSLTRANKLLEEGRVARPEAAILAYLEGRVRMLEGKAEEALKQLDRAVTLEPADTLFQLWRAESQAELGQIQKSFNAYASTLKQNPNHVGTLIARARLLLETKGDLAKAQKDLEDILSGARSSLSSKGQRGWAAALMARILLARGDITRARTFLTKARTNQPTRDPLFLDQLAQAYLESYQAGEAERVIQESRDLLPGRPHPHFYLARVYLLQGRSARALVSLRKARGLASPAAMLLKARILFSLGRHQEALAEANGVLDSHKGHLRASLLHAEILATQGKGSEAEQRLLALLPANRRSVELLTTLGEVYLQMGRTHQARKRLGEAVRLDRFTFQARLKLAEVDLAEGKFAAAHKRLGEAARANLGNTVALRKLADLEFAMGNLPQARELYASLVKRSGNDPEVRLGFSRVLAALHEDALAETELRAAEARQADRARVALVRGEFALAQGKAPLALSQLAVATGGSKPTAEALHLHARAHLMNNDEHGAKGIVQRLASLYPGSPEALDAAGRAEHYAGNFSRAVRTFGQAVQSLRTAPRPPLVHARMLVMAGRAHQDNGRSDHAMPQYEAAARICSRCPEPHYRIGLVHDENERSSDAIASLRRAKSLDPKMMEIYYDLGSVLERASRTSEAAAAYKTYLSLNPPRELADAAKEALENLGQ